MKATPQRRYASADFVLRPWEPADAERMSEAVVSSYDHLRPWLDWASREQDAAASEAIIRDFVAEWEAERDFVIGIFSPDEEQALGGTGFHLRNRPLGEKAEIGMWIRGDRAGSGLGSSVLDALLGWGFDDWGFRRLTWFCDVRNTGSRRVAEKCGMRLEGHLIEEHRQPDGSFRDTLMFAKLAREHG